MSFVRRYTSYPGLETITAIEGAIIIDLVPPGSIQGVGTGVACCVGECPDLTYATAVAADGSVTTRATPTEVFSAQDLVNKIGSFDETVGEFGKSGGNLFTDIRGKRFARLVVVPINLASPKGARVFRDLPTNKSATDPNPIVPMAAAGVAAGREFKTGANRVRIGKRVVFSDSLSFVSAIDGVQVTNAGPAATAAFTSATGAFVVNGVRIGDILVLGVIGGAGVPGTYRVKTVDSATQLTVERMDGVNFTWAGVTALPFRLHAGATADSGGVNDAVTVNGYSVPARPLDATIAAATLVPPTVVPAAGTATTWDPLSGLTLRTMPGGGGGLTYDANVQAVNAVSHASLDALYVSAIDTLLSDVSPANEVNILWASRKSTNIATKLKTHALTQSAQGAGRMSVSSPALDQVSLTVITGDTAPGVGANRDERVIYSWPGAATFVPEAVGLSVKGADQVAHVDGLLDLSFDSWEASAISLLPPERNPGEASPTTKLAFGSVLGLQRLAPTLGIAEYTLLRQKGISALRIDKTAGPIIQSGITTSLVSGTRNINRRRMADFIEDSLASRLVQYAKLPLTQQLKDGAAAETVAFLTDLKSANNPAAQRINDFFVDTKSGNTPQLEAAGVFVINVNVRTLATADFIVIQAAIGEGVEISSS